MFETDSVLLTNGRIFDGTGEEVIDNGAVWVEGEQIRRVGRPAEWRDVPDDVRRIDLRGRFVMPGMVEPHVHLGYFDATTLQDIDYNAAPEDTTIKAVLNARTMLRSGYTSACSFGTVHNVDVTLRDHIDQGSIPGPRLLACGRDVASTGGMVDWNPDHMKLEMEGLAFTGDNPWEVRKIVRTIRKGGADVVKIYLDGELMVPGDAPGEITFTLEEVKAAVDEAHRRKLTVACHARSAEAVKLAVQGGVDIIGHANYLDDEALAMLRDRRRDVFVTPAIHWEVGLYENGADFGLTSGALNEMGYKEEITETVKSVNMMRSAGVRVLPGGDFGLAWTPHGSYARDLQNFVDLFGYTPEEVLTTVTRHAGELMGMGGQVGTLEAGKWADLLVVDGDPLADITVLQDHDRIVGIMKGGEFFHDALTSPAASLA